MARRTGGVGGTGGRGHRPTTTGEGHDQAGRLLERFRTFWLAPDADAAVQLFTEDVQLSAPMLVSTRGKVAARHSFARALSALPDLRGEVVRAVAHEEGLFVELRFSASLGNELMTWPAVDRLDLRDGLIAERVSYFDSLPLARAVVAHPAALLRNARLGIRPRAPGHHPSPGPAAGIMGAHDWPPVSSRLSVLGLRPARVLRRGQAGDVGFREVFFEAAEGGAGWGMVERLHGDAGEVLQRRAFCDTFPLWQRMLRRPWRWREARTAIRAVSATAV